MQITLIRHLPTSWNQENRYQGRQDIDVSPISPMLRDEIYKNQKLLKELGPFDLVIASTLKRTQQTAQAYGFKAEQEALLDELDFGSYEGQPKQTLLKECGNMWVENPKELILGESLKDFEQRVIRFLDQYHEYKNILIFGHGSWIRAFVSYTNFGDINNMNKITVGNNELISISLKPGEDLRQMEG